MFVRFCRFPPPLGVCEGLRFVIVAFPGLFSYLSLHRDLGLSWLVVKELYPLLHHPTPPPRWFTLLTVLRGGPCVSLTLCCFVVYSTRRFVLCLALCCCFFFFFFSVLLALRLSRLRKRASLGAFRTFVRFALVCFVYFLFLLVSGKGCGL